MPAPSRRSIHFSWFGAVLCAMGTGLILVYRSRPSLWFGNPMAKVLYLGMGGVLLLWGIRTVLAELWPVIGGLSREGWRGYHVRMPRAAAVFMLIMFMLFLGALLGRSNMLVLVFGLMAGPFILNGSITLNMLRKTKATRTLPDRVMAGQVFSVDLTLANSKQLMSSWMTEVHDSLRSRYEHLEPAILFTRVPPRSSRTGSYQARLAHRGVYELGPMQISSRFPLGLMERVVEVGDIERVVVLPQVGRLLPAWYRAASYNNELVDQPRSRKGSFDDEFHQLREYRSGDNPRAIHWRTSARRNVLMVREFHQNRDQDLLLALDLWLPDRPTPLDSDRVELAVSFAATLCVEHCGQSGESNLWLGVAGTVPDDWSGQATSLALDEVLERLAIAEASHKADFDDLIARSDARLEGPGRRVLISTRPDEALTTRTVPGDILVLSAASGVLLEYFERDAG